MTHQAESPEVFVLLDAFIGRMRLISSRDVSQVAESLARLMIDPYAASNLTSQQMQENGRGEALYPPARFGEACLTELSIFRV